MRRQMRQMMKKGGERERGDVAVPLGGGSSSLPTQVGRVGEFTSLH